MKQIKKLHVLKNITNTSNNLFDINENIMKNSLEHTQYLKGEESICGYMHGSFVSYMGDVCVGLHSKDAARLSIIENAEVGEVF